MDFANLYSEKDRKIMKDAAASLNRNLGRVEEIIEYAVKSGIRKIGIAHCTTFNNEAEMLEKILSSKGFQVLTVNCKYGKLASNDIIEGHKGISCNPAGQAHFLAENNTELNIVLGLCLGHDMIFNNKSQAPVTTLIVKDRTLKNKGDQFFINS